MPANAPHAVVNEGSTVGLAMNFVDASNRDAAAASLEGAAGEGAAALRRALLDARACPAPADHVSYATFARSGPSPAPPAPSPGAALDAFHAAAARGDADAYVALLAADFVFLGTDATERWDRFAFEAYARARFARGDEWTYEVLARRATAVAPRVVAFDEDLRHATLGRCRGSGILVADDDDGGGLKVARYALSVPIPNAIVVDVARRIRDDADPPDGAKRRRTFGD